MNPLVIGAILSLIGTVLGIGATAVENNKNREQNEKLQEKQNEFNSTEAEKANEREISNYMNYESPAAKLQQTKQAGLSPSVMYAGNGISGALRSAPQATAASVSPYYSNNQMGMLFSQLGTNLGDTVKSLAGAKNDITDIEKKKEEIKKINEEVKKIDAETEKIHEEIKQTKNETALAGWKYSKTLTVSYSQLQAWSNGETTSWNEATGESYTSSINGNGGVEIKVMGTGGGFNGSQGASESESYTTSGGSSYSKADSATLSQSGSTSVLFVPKIENGEIKEIYCYILEKNYDPKALEIYNEDKTKREKKNTKQKTDNDKNEYRWNSQEKSDYHDYKKGKISEDHNNIRSFLYQR